MTNWEYRVVPLPDAAEMKKDSGPWSPETLNELGGQGWEAVGVALKAGHLAGWPMVLVKRSID